jgi:transcriptional regulator with XRE-family HTH domain
MSVQCGTHRSKGLIVSGRFLVLAAAVAFFAPDAATKDEGSPGTASRDEELEVLCAVGLRQVMIALTPTFEQETGHTLAVTFDSGAVIGRRVQGGETADVVIIPRAAIDDLVRAGTVVASSVVDVASSAVGVGVRRGAPRPDISSPEAFKRTLLAVFVRFRPSPTMSPQRSSSEAIRQTIHITLTCNMRRWRQFVTWLADARRAKGWTQAEAAARLGFSQTYWSFLENGRRQVPARLLPKLRQHFEVPGEVAPLTERSAPHSPDALAAALAGLRYPGFTYVRRRTFVNPAVVLWAALRSADLETRLFEALPWVAWKYSDLDWNWLSQRLKVSDQQNRLGFVVALAKQVASDQRDRDAGAKLAVVEARLERARLVREDTLCRETMTDAERRWLTSARSAVAAHWNVLSDLRAETLPHVA